MDSQPPNLKKKYYKLLEYEILNGDTKKLKMYSQRNAVLYWDASFVTQNKQNCVTCRFTGISCNSKLHGFNLFIIF